MFLSLLYDDQHTRLEMEKKKIIADSEPVSKQCLMFVKLINLLRSLLLTDLCVGRFIIFSAWMRIEFFVVIDSTFMLFSMEWLSDSFLPFGDCSFLSASFVAVVGDAWCTQVGKLTTHEAWKQPSATCLAPLSWASFVRKKNRVELGKTQIYD